MNRNNKGQFTPGIVPWNKGKKYHAGGRSRDTQFSKGHKPVNHKPVGTIRTNVDGYLEIKIAEGINKWRLLHREVWKQHHGAYPPRGYALIFKDNDKTNVEINNLQLIPRRDLMKKNSVHNLPESIKQVIVINALITRKINATEKATN